jgi:hypothetical protein
MSSKHREVLEQCDALLKRITKSAWFIEARMGLTKEVMDVGNAITEALTEPVRNCDIGTPEEQSVRMSKFCSEQYEKSDGIMLCSSCRFHGIEGLDCQFAWSQMPYEGEVK